jgi:DNA-directed RNA polymerase specialized sigma24 family protein
MAILAESPMKEAAPKSSIAELLPYVQGHTRTWNDSWQRLYAGWNDVIVAFCLRQGLNHQSAQNVFQESMITLLRSYQGQAAGYDSRQGSFQAWLWGVVRNRIKSERRRHNKEILVATAQETRNGERSGLLPEACEPAVDCARAEAEQERQAVWVAALQRVRQRVKSENFEIYAALLKQSSPPEALARKHGKTVNNIYAIKHRCDELLITEARAIRKQQAASPMSKRNHYE